MITWDLNFAFSGSADTGPHDKLSLGGLGLGPRDGQAPPEGAPAMDGTTGAGDAGGIRRMMGGNKLKERFLADPALNERYEQAYRELYQQMYADGTALRALDGLASAVPTSDKLDAATITTNLDELRAIVTDRAVALARDPDLVGTTS